ncbi:hypothetical protein [Burkholderia ubonensis]|uniref:Uncharacterized protein n=1 Tax=Burkholderia ubonensis TaxID=101571 RepID=A0A107F6U5_9BURK|nr:hypothetical protein WL71_13190 [Burkholderia ubonensis]KWD88070.1 hypothetical protein WL70_00440 [Burkholderia ubonensis]KWD91422.1 hypothetical protein WL72_30255 [Burkholderia ubonensis]KWD92184.1 hypothetical protein WL73_29575 [Burkholderia ubonensis]
MRIAPDCDGGERIREHAALFDQPARNNADSSGVAQTLGQLRLDGAIGRCVRKYGSPVHTRHPALPDYVFAPQVEF